MMEVGIGVANERKPFYTVDEVTTRCLRSCARRLPIVWNGRRRGVAKRRPTLQGMAVLKKTRRIIRNGRYDVQSTASILYNG